MTGGSGFIGGRLIRRLVREGWSVRALARSEPSAAAVRDAGAEPALGDIGDPAAIRAGAEGCTTAFHAAAVLSEWGPWEEFERGNVQGTRNALEACRAAGVGRFVHVGTEAALLDGRPLVRVDESEPLRPDSRAHYPRSKALAEQAVRSAAASGFDTVVIRPRLVWGPGDRTILPGLVDAVRRGRFAWVGGGSHLTSTTHVDNAVHGLLLGAERGTSGEAYFVTDGEPIVFREFVTRLLATQGVAPPARSLPAAVAGPAAVASEGLWRLLPLPGTPPLTRIAVWLSGLECTIDIGKARSQLGYEPEVSRDDGLAALASERP